MELKVYSSLVQHTYTVQQGCASSPNATSYHGDTHAFGNTEECRIRMVLGVELTREFDTTWGPSVRRLDQPQRHTRTPHALSKRATYRTG